MHIPDQVKWAKDRDVDKLFKLLKAENKFNALKKSQTETQYFGFVRLFAAGL